MSAEPSTLEERTSSPEQIEIRSLFGKKTVIVDEVIHGRICDDTWRGTVYVACDLELPAWEQDAFFLSDCDLTIEPGTLVFVAAHNDKQYSEGCSCHE
jgi:hypothetical protein